ncbi:late blight resistance homolog R1A-10 [Olea europaea subsp. europaea]|uniref:Late blight resistance homolog R1A-10 n=1 Tax=Olea europaea subsp. europaea TaxID=158383 RepID=A0A8S0TUG1_OLEEU|nr:late blight resistance homolog R1A-10 [Olea europaea subsp. europaea]
MDDLWDKKAWDDLQRSFPEDENGSRVLLTSRLRNVAEEISKVIVEPQSLSPGESWTLLEQKLFKKERCPQELQDIGKQIAENCHGLPLSVVTVAGVLSNMEKKESLWQQVAERLSSYISQNADDYIPSLKLSYTHLPNHLKTCFLYLSAFHRGEEIPVQKLLLLWIADGFIEKKEHEILEDEAEEYLTELINRSLLQVSVRRSDNGVKACIVHDLVLDMCWKTAEEENFLFQHQFLISKHFHGLRVDQSHHLPKALLILHESEKNRVFESTGYDIRRIKNMSDLRYLDIAILESSIARLQNLEVLLVHWLNDDIPTYLLNMPMLRHLRVGSSDIPARFRISLPWEKMSLIGTLPFLEILKLECEAFIGEIWDTKDDEFQKLKFLKLYRIYIEQWNSSCYHFPVLERLVLRSCTNLEMIPSEFSSISTLQKIEVDDCIINVKNSALQIRDEQKDYGNEEFDVTIYSVWE